MPMGKECTKTMHRQCIGIARRQNKGMHKLNLIWAGFMSMVEEFVKMIHRQCIGIARRQNKGLQKLNLIWV